LENKKININELKPAEYNPRIMPEEEYNKLKNSLDTFGLVDPIIIDLKHNNTIIGGHQRYQVLIDENPEQELQLIQLGDIGLIIKETNIKLNDINDQKALNLALNKIQGEWDYNKLDDLLIELTDDHYQIELTGFDDIDLMESTLTNEIKSLEDIQEELHHDKRNTTPNDDDIDEELDNGVTEWDKYNNEVEHEIRQTDNTTFRFYYQNGDTILLGDNKLIINDTSFKDISLNFKDELIITTTHEQAEQIKTDNQYLIDRTHQREQLNARKRKELSS